MKTMTKRSATKKLLRSDQCCGIVNDADIEEAVSLAIRVAGALGFSGTTRCMIGTTVSELARNIHRYSRAGGTMRITEVRRGRRVGIEIVAEDDGPGIKNVRKALQDNYSTSKGSLGIGLPGVKRMMDDFRIKSVDGTRVTVRKWLP